MRFRYPCIIFPLLNYVVAFVFLPFSILQVTSELFTLISLAFWLVAVAIWERRYLKIRHIFLGIVLMWILVLVYCPDGLYGIGNDGILDFSPKEIDALFVCSAIALFQVTVTVAICAVEKVRRLIAKK